MKTQFLRSLLITAAALFLLASPVFSQVQPPTTVQLPQNFFQIVKDEYDALPPPQEVTLQTYYGQSVERFYHDAAISLDPTIVYDPGNISLVLPCNNGNFESGLTGWTGGYGSVGSNCVVNYPGFISGFSSGILTSAAARQTIVTPGIDATTGIIPHVHTTMGGAQALRLGNKVAGRGAELIAKRFTVTAALANVTFWYAVVLQDCGSTQNPACEPGFKVRVRNSAGTYVAGLVNLGAGTVGDEITGQSPASAFTGTAGGAKYRNWGCGTINLSSMIGQIVTVEFVTRDCSQNGHWGYAYLDNLCGNCSPVTPCSIALGTVGCGDKQSICVNYTLPSSSSGSGSITLTLTINQNGSATPIATLTSGPLTSGSTYCFPINMPALIAAGLDPNLGGFDFRISSSCDPAPSAATIGSVATGIDGVVNNDYRVSCGCCPGQNLIVNPGFESGNTGFSSSYTYQPTIAAGSVTPGRYGIMTSTQAPTVCSAWLPNCNAYGRHMIVNGRTGVSGGAVSIWKQTVTIQRGVPYKFCIDLKNLPVCCFDVKPIVSVKFSEPGFDIAPTVINQPAGTCNWRTLTQTITLPGSGTVALTIDVLLDQTGTGDGNDLAIDNITLVQIPILPLSAVMFNIAYINITGSTFGIAATPVSPLSSDCQSYWEVAELDAANNPIPSTQVIDPPSWPPTGTNTFIGYNGTSTLSGTLDGVFSSTRRYRIVYARWCECKGFRSYAIILQPDPITGARTIKVDESFELPADKVSAIMSHDLKRTAAPEKGSPSLSAAGGNVPGDASSIRVFPNPTEDRVTVLMDPAAYDVQLKLMTPSGQVLKTIQVKAGETQASFQMKELAAGMYLLQATSRDRMILNEKVIKL